MKYKLTAEVNDTALPEVIKALTDAKAEIDIRPATQRQRPKPASSPQPKAEVTMSLHPDKKMSEGLALDMFNEFKGQENVKPSEIKLFIKSTKEYSTTSTHPTLRRLIEKGLVKKVGPSTYNFAKSQ
jgi:hypothetical protein